MERAGDRVTTPGMELTYEEQVRGFRAGEVRGRLELLRDHARELLARETGDRRAPLQSYLDNLHDQLDAAERAEVAWAEYLRRRDA